MTLFFICFLFLHIFRLLKNDFSRKTDGRDNVRAGDNAFVVLDVVCVCALTEREE